MLPRRRPVLIHRYWSGPPNPLEPWLGQVVRQFNPGDEVRDWTDETLPPGTLSILRYADRQVRPVDRMRHRANLIRLMLLADMGGRWADADLIPLTPFASLPLRTTAAHGAFRCNSYLSVGAPRHPAILEALRLALAVPFDGKARSVDVSGERLLERVLPDDFARLQLPIDSAGYRLPGGGPWAVHLYQTAARVD